MQFLWQLVYLHCITLHGKILSPSNITLKIVDKKCSRTVDKIVLLVFKLKLLKLISFIKKKMLLLSIATSLFMCAFGSDVNNACSNLLSYPFSAFSRDCYHNFDVFSDVVSSTKIMLFCFKLF